MLVVWLVVVAFASCLSRLRRSVRASFRRSRTETTAAVMSCEFWVRSRTLPMPDSRREGALQPPLGHAQLELAAGAGRDLRRHDVAAQVVGDPEDLRRGAVDVARRGGERDLRGALDVAVGGGGRGECGGGGRGAACGVGLLARCGLVGRGGCGLVGVGRRLARRRPAAAGAGLVAAPAAARDRGGDHHDEEDGRGQPEGGQRELRPRERAALRGMREAPPRPLVERVGEGGVRGGALVAHEERELGQVGQVGVDRAAGERVVERGQLAGEGLRRAHRWPFAAS